MRITNEQYETIMAEYADIRSRHEEELRQRIDTLYKKHPALKQVKDELKATRILQLQAAIGLSDRRISDADIQRLKDIEKKEMKIAKITDKFFEVEYECPKCKDTGYYRTSDISPMFECECLKQKKRLLSVHDDCLPPKMNRQNFLTFNPLYYSDEIIPSLGVSPRDVALRRKAQLEDFCKNFDNLPEKSGFVILGDRSAGKTFLANCVASQLTTNSYNVCFTSCSDMLDTMRKAMFEKNHQTRQVYNNFKTSDMLILDDLGGETSLSDFTSSTIFNLLNQRFIERKPVLITSRLSLDELRQAYSDRLFSRLFQYCNIIKLL